MATTGAAEGPRGGRWAHRSDQSKPNHLVLEILVCWHNIVVSSWKVDQRRTLCRFCKKMSYNNFLLMTTLHSDCQFNYVKWRHPLEFAEILFRQTMDDGRWSTLRFKMAPLLCWWKMSDDHANYESPEAQEFVKNPTRDGAPEFWSAR